MLPILLFLSPPAAVSEPVEAKTVEKAAQPEQEEEKPALAFEIGNIWLTPFIGPAYNPEMEFVIGAGIMLSFKSDKESPRSTISATASYGTVGAGQVYIRVQSYFNNDTLRFIADIAGRYMNDKHLRVRHEKASSTPLGPDTSKFTRGWFQIKPTISTQIAGSTYLGGMLDFNGTRATNLNPVMAADPNVVSQGTDFLNLGFGPVIEYDTRDV